MKRNYKAILAVVAISLALWSFNPKKPANNPEKDKLLIELLTYVIEKGHYNPADIDDNLSKGIYKDYIEALDPAKRFFMQSDIDAFKKYELQIDDQIRNKDLTFFNLTYDRLMQRMDETKSFYKEILNSAMDYSIDEEFNVDYKNLPFAKNANELKEKWRKQIKFSTLSSFVAKQKDEEDKLKKDANYVVKSNEKIEKETRESSLNNYNDLFNSIKDLEKDDWFSVYLNAITSRFDPHTSYFPPNEKERFDVSMSGKLEGIGARLQKKNDFTEITELISGGPAWRGKELEAGDIILKVAQGNDEPVEVVGMRLDDVVKKIKGPKGTLVKLTVKKTDGTIKIISIVRDEVEIEETYAKSSIIEKNGTKYGIIYLPKFYIDFEDKNRRDAGKDIALEIERLKKEGIQGLVFDVRDNGGGSLKTVVDIAGLFIEKGPIVQVKSAAGRKEVLSDLDEKVQWNGPLVIMVNEFSASASEILAAAMQDYKRAVILGSKQTYGKGTVQNVIDLNQFLRGNEYGELGALKTTTQKFYRINGGSTQLEGVHSDVFMPDAYSYLKMGERDIENAMPWDKIDATDYKPVNVSKLDYAIANSKKRLENNAQLKLIDENAKWRNDRNNVNSYSLNIDKFKTEQKLLEDESKKYKVLEDYTSNFKFDALSYEKDLMANDKSLKEKRESWFESLSKDIYLEEAFNILDDLQSNPSKKELTNKISKEKLIKS